MSCNPAASHTAPGSYLERTSRAGYGITAVKMIWAQDHNRVIGAGGGMLWHVPGDLKFFQTQTLGAPVVMGRTSFEALGKPLPHRRNIVLTSSAQLDAAATYPNLEVAPNLEAALQMCRDEATVWIAGGGKVYQEVMDHDLADGLVVTQLDLQASIPPGTKPTFAPEIDLSVWELDRGCSDAEWRDVSGDCAWRVRYYRHR